MRSLGALLPLWLALGVPAAAAATQDPEQIRGAAEAFLTEYARDLHGDRAFVQTGRLDPRLRLAACEGTLEAFLPPGGRTLGSTVVGVRCPATQGWTVYVPGEIGAMVPVVIAARPLGRGDLLSPRDLTVTERNASELPPGYLPAAAEALGKRMRRPVTAGTPLTGSLLEAPVLVRRGQQVTVLAETAGVSVRIAGKALGNGAEGQRVRVQNLSSTRVVEGTVVADGLVRVDP